MLKVHKEKAMSEETFARIFRDLRVLNQYSKPVRNTILSMTKGSHDSQVNVKQGGGMGLRQLFFGGKLQEAIQRAGNGSNAQFSVTMDSQNAYEYNQRNRNIFVRASDYFLGRSEFSYDATNVLSQLERSIVLNGRISTEDIVDLKYAYQIQSTDVRLHQQLGEIYKEKKVVKEKT